MKLLNNWRKKQLIKDMTTPKPLPLGVSEFHEWSDRIIQYAMVSADATSLKYALANILMQLKPTEDHVEDAYFIKSLRKAAVNQVADAIRREIYDARKAQEDAKQEASN